MYAEPYRACLECDRTLDETTMYRRHAYCPDCTRLASSEQASDPARQRS